MISLRDVVTGFGNRDPLAEVWRRNLRSGGGGAAVITGVPPLRYIGNGRPLTDYRISGNTVQDGTPSHDDPVYAAGSGVRTAQIIDYTLSESGGIDASGNLSAAANLWRSNVFYGIYGDITLSFVKYPTLQRVRVNYYDENYSHISREELNMDAASGVSLTIPTSAKYFKWTLYASTGTIIDIDFVRQCYIMFNAGSTALPYEPYGYKLPLTVNGTEHPIYLGQVETTRKIVKRTFNGSESFDLGSVIGQIVFNTGLTLIDNGAICSHYILKKTYSSTGKPYIRLKSNAIWFELDNTGYETKEACLSDFIAYLKQQYANGTPVIIWYVLATEETAIVNEPLMKIGDYADTVSFAQAGVTIPTVNGENVLDVPTEVPPSQITIKGGIRDV